MVNPDNTRIRFEPNEEGEYGVTRPPDDVKPIEGPKPAKDFKKVYSKTGEEGKEDCDRWCRSTCSLRGNAVQDERVD